MTASQGRAWLSGALVASGLALVTAAGPARAGQIHHDSGTTQPAPSTPMNATESFQQSVTNFLKAWQDRAMPPMPAAVPTSGMTYPAAEYLAPPATSAVPTWHQSQAPACNPPTPPPPSTCGTSTGGTSTGGSTAPALLAPPSALQSPTPAPEPSTIVSALALAGLLAWRRRRGA